LAIAQLTAQELSSEAPLVDEDTLSLNSFFVGDKHATSDFDKKKRTLLERLFAVDKEVRKGRLLKHVRKDKLAAIAEGSEQQRSIDQNADVANLASDGPRALVIEGAALKHLLGDPELEEIIFSVASNCDAVIACRVSPKQKALLVHLVRHHVVPEPVTLAIGDGANDVGMIQEAHVGVGISGKEGKQAVNSSDFAIAQFRFLEDLLLVHGRWNFFRMTTVVLFSFYKNAIMAGCLIAYTAQTLYSGTPLFDQWIIAVLNFVAGIPIIVLGLFDRCMDKSYVRRHPEVYKPTRNNELLTIRTQLRWICLVFVHIFTIYYMTVPTLAREGGGITSAFLGLMRNKGFDSPGDGEAGDLKSVGTVTFSCLITLLAYKVIVRGETCSGLLSL
jgi:magnesium-transporting ATPase (P-type)